MPGRNRQHAVPQDLRVVVRVDVDETGCDDLVAGLDLRRRAARRLAECNDAAVLDGDIALAPGAPVPSMIVPPVIFRS